MKPCLPNVWRHFYTMFTDMFTPFMKICLHLDYIYVNIMLQHTFPANLKTFYIMLEDMFAICLETSLNHVKNMCKSYLHKCLHHALTHIWRFVYTMLEDIYMHNMFVDKFKASLITCFNHVRRHVYTMLIKYLCIVWNMFTQYLKAYSHWF